MKKKEDDKHEVPKEDHVQTGFDKNGILRNISEKGICNTRADICLAGQPKNQKQSVLLRYGSV